MSADDLPFKVVKTNGRDETIARAGNLLVGRTAYEKATPMYPLICHLGLTFFWQAPAS
jgi:hypothetical protein